MVCILDARWYDEFAPPLARLGVDALPSLACAVLDAPVSYHPDMALFPTGPASAVCAPSVYAGYAALLGEKGIKVVQGTAVLTSNYPSCVAYNVAKAGAVAFHLRGATDPVILEEFKRNGITLACVKQGFSKCAVSVLADGAIITADPTILRAAAETGVPALAIRPGFVRLPGYDCGFLGGASGLIGDGRLAFCGDLRRHPNAAEIVRFCARHGTEAVSLSDGPLTDVGSLLCFD